MRDLETGLTAERLRQLLAYDCDTGDFSCLVPRGLRTTGEIVGSPDRHGYNRVCIDGRYYFGHRLAWLYMTGAWPSLDIDHINGVPGDDRWVNLREATKAQNQANRRRNAGQKWAKGVYYKEDVGRWLAHITVARRFRSLGSFGSESEAHAAYVAAARAVHGEFARPD